MIPITSSVTLRFREGWSLWIPLFPVWLVLTMIGALLFPFVLIAGMATGVDALQVYITGWRILSAMRDTVVEVDDPEVHVRVKFA